MSRKKKTYFINIPNINKNNLQISNVGEYSMTPPKDAKKLCKIIKKYFDKNITITDTTANNGGNTIAFALEFNSVNAVEIEKKEYDILVNNINVYKLKNVKTYNNDYLKVLEKLEQDIIFIDPPWGGKEYKKENNLQLYLSNKNLFEIIDLLKNKCQSIICKVPFNYCFNKLFEKYKKIKKIHLYKFKKYVIFILIDKRNDNVLIEDYLSKNIY
jgi:16S rRNA G966 N2-methylase RsmD